MTVVIDDHLLLACLSRREPLSLTRVRRRGRTFTTGLWYHRLCRALASPNVSGALSGVMGQLTLDEAQEVLAAAGKLSPTYGVVSFRHLAWPMAEILLEARLNVMLLEALGAARLLDATICVSERNQAPALFPAADEFGVPVLTISA